MRAPRILVFLGYFLAAGSLAWTAVWALVGWLWPDGPVWATGLAMFFGAFALMTGTTWSLGYLVGRKRPDVSRVFNEAFQRISRGDYSVQIPTGPGEHLHRFESMAENLNSMAANLAKIEDLRRQFTADVSHEFQSPLTSILGFAQALQAAGIPESLRLRYLGIIEAEARRLSRLADNLLKLNTLDDQDGPPDPASFRLDVQLRQVLVTLEPQWSAKGLVIEADLAETTLTGNEGLWTQVWTNLIQNAVKFTPRGGRVTVRIPEGSPLRVEVEDSGIGLEAEEAGRVFERFYKAESARSHTDGATGSGLGLALAHRIVTLHGGTIEASSPGLGQGTTLRVTLPGRPPV